MTDTVRHAPGIYFDLPGEAYYSDDALSSSKIKTLLISPLAFWSKHMDPKRPPPPVDKAHFKAGKAHHAMLMEPALFATDYCRDFDPADYPDALDGMAALREYAERIGVKAGRSIADACAAIRAADAVVQLAPELKSEWEKKNGGKVALKSKQWNEMHRARDRLYEHPQLRDVFRDGAAEVSIFWIDEETGVRMKARLDYLRPDRTVDLKTFGGEGRPVDKEVGMAVARYRYNVQAAVYDQARAQARRFIEAGQVFGKAPAKLVKAVLKAEQWDFLFVFIQTGDVPEIRGRIMPVASVAYEMGKMGMELGVRRYATLSKEFGTDRPWITDNEVRPFRDDEFPNWITEV